MLYRPNGLEAGIRLASPCCVLQTNRALLLSYTSQKIQNLPFFCPPNNYLNYTTFFKTMQVKNDKNQKKRLTTYSFYVKIEALTEEQVFVNRLNIIGRKRL